MRIRILQRHRAVRTAAAWNIVPLSQRIVAEQTYPFVCREVHRQRHVIIVTWVCARGLTAQSALMSDDAISAKFKRAASYTTCVCVFMSACKHAQQSRRQLRWRHTLTNTLM